MLAPLSRAQVSSKLLQPRPANPRGVLSHGRMFVEMMAEISPAPAMGLRPRAPTVPRNGKPDAGRRDQFADLCVKEEQWVRYSQSGRGGPARRAHKKEESPIRLRGQRRISFAADSRAHAICARHTSVMAQNFAFCCAGEFWMVQRSGPSRMAEILGADNPML